MPAPYSTDLRQRIVSAYDNGQTRVCDLANLFQVSRHTVSRYIARHKANGHVAPDPHGGGRQPVIGMSQVDKLVAVVGAKPDATIKQMCVTYKKMHGQSVTQSAMQRGLSRFGITSKKSLSLRQSRRVHASWLGGPNLKN